MLVIRTQDGKIIQVLDVGDYDPNPMPLREGIDYQVVTND